MENKKKLYVIDGNSLLFRAFYATFYGDPTNIMRTKEGVPTNAIFAFSNMISKILQSFKGGESIFVGFDSDKETFRKQEFEAYKANRKPCPPELVPQFPISRELLKCLNIVNYEEHGIEADDICGTVAKKAGALGYEVIVYTSDKDYLQLIDDNITVSLLKTGFSNMEVMTPKTMPEKFGFSPLQIIDYKGLMGDTSDNLPGIPGIGEKTAVKLIQEYGSFEAIVEAAQTMTSKMGEKIRNGAELGRACYRLATILTDVKLPFEIEDLVYQGYDFATVNEFAQKYELKQFLARLPVTLKKGSDDADEIKVERVSSLAGFDASNGVGLAIDVDESTYHDAPIEGIAFANKTTAYYLSVDDLKKDEYAISVLKDPTISKCVYDGKLIKVCLHRLGLDIQGIDFDILLAAYLLDSSLSNSPSMVYSSFGSDISSSDSQMSLFASGNPETIGKMACYALSLKDKALLSLKSVDAYSLYTDIEAPLSMVLADMEIEGFPLDKATLNQIGDGFKAKLKSIENDIYECVGERFNIASPKQVGDLLFNKLQLAESKSMSTSVEVLNSLKDKHPVVSKILEFRKYSKLVGTYIDGLIPHVKEDGKIHTTFNQAQTTTGRLSSSNPNLQNISARDEEGKLIRKAFFYKEEGHHILSLDYSQVELRILASLSGDETYIDVFNSGRDVHSETAKRIFHVEEATGDMRRKAKAANFAIIYGTTAFGLADQIHSSVGEATRMIQGFYLSYPAVSSYLNSIIADVEHNGYVTTMFGRRRYLRDIVDPNYAKREAAKRAALNAPVQGSAADIIKIAMLKVAKYLKDNNLKTKMVLQIHDELLFDVPEEEMSLVKEQIAKIMVNAVKLKVNLEVEGGYGRTWYDAKD